MGRSRASHSHRNVLMMAAFRAALVEDQHTTLQSASRAWTGPADDHGPSWLSARPRCTTSSTAGPQPQDLAVRRQRRLLAPTVAPAPNEGLPAFSSLLTG